MDGVESSAHPAVAIRRAELSYPTPEGELPVLCGIDMEVRHSEILAVMGPSGSGKTSIIALIGGLEKATGGEVNVLGHDLRDSTDSELTALRRNDIGIVFQSYHLVPAMTALQNAALPLILAGAADAHDRAREMLHNVGLGHRLTHRPASLSGGEQQRVAIARAFVSSPRLILADEPTGNLDQSTGGEVAEVMLKLVRDTGAAMLIVTHDPSLAALCDRIVVIDAGRIVA